LLAKSNLAAFEGLPDGAKQHLIIEWFSKKFDCACRVTLSICLPPLAMIASTFL
jgi:hypothetical protein